MNKKVILSLLLVIGLLFTACKDDKKKEETDDSEEVTTEEKISLTKIEDFVAYDDVTLALEEPSTDNLEPGTVDFKFEVQNMEIGEGTPDEEERGLAYGEEGQHIHFIIDNEPYMAHYSTEFSHELDEGIHTLVAFPARSYHMSVKNDGAVIAKKLTVGNPDQDQYENVDFTKPTLIYSRPKGDYKGESETTKVLLDFFLLNTTLSPNGNRVKATINGEEFIIDDWAPYAIEGLPLGENTVKLELIDEDDNVIEGDFNQVERTFNLGE